MTRDRGDMQPTSYGPLFDPPVKHLVHRNDPETSRDAADRVRGRLGFWQTFALDAVRTHPGHTTKELAALLMEPEGDTERVRQQIGRRLPELDKARKVRREGTRNGCALWWPVKE